MAIPVAVFGAGGRMGRAVCQAVAADPASTLVAAVDPAFAGLPLSEVAGVEGPEGAIVVAGDPQRVGPAGAAVAIDFTVREAALENLAACAAAGVHGVVGTSGFGAEDLAVLDRLFERSACLVAPNFAIGAVLLMRFAAQAAPYFETAEIIELHHDGKVDAPSGTAVATAERMAAASAAWAADPTTVETLPGARGGQGAGGIRVHAVRLRGLVAHQEVVLGTTGQTLTLRHDSLDRSSFMPGVLLAVARVGGLRPGVTVGLDAVLDG